MSKPKHHTIPAWVKLATTLTTGILTIDSIDAVGVNVRGAGFDYKLTYQKSIDRWLQGMPGLDGYPGTSRIDIHFTFKNTGAPGVSGFVQGNVDQTSLSTFQVGNLAHGASASGVVSFHPLNVLGDHVIFLAFRQPIPSPFGASVVLAKTGTNYFVY